MSERNFLRPYVGKEISGCGRLVFVNRVKNEKTGEIGTREGKKYVGLISPVYFLTGDKVQKASHAWVTFRDDSPKNFDYINEVIKFSSRVGMYYYATKAKTGVSVKDLRGITVVPDKEQRQMHMDFTYKVPSDVKRHIEQKKAHKAAVRQAKMTNEEIIRAFESDTLIRKK